MTFENKNTEYVSGDDSLNESVDDSAFKDNKEIKESFLENLKYFRLQSLDYFYLNAFFSEKLEENKIDLNADMKDIAADFVEDYQSIYNKTFSERKLLNIFERVFDEDKTDENFLATVNAYYLKNIYADEVHENIKLYIRRGMVSDISQLNERINNVIHNRDIVIKKPKKTIPLEKPEDFSEKIEEPKTKHVTLIPVKIPDEINIDEKFDKDGTYKNYAISNRNKRRDMANKRKKSKAHK